MKNLKLSKILLFVLVGGIIPLAFVYIVTGNRLKFIGSGVILGLVLALFIIICAATVGYRFQKLTKEEKIANVIAGTIVYSIVYCALYFTLLKPEKIDILNFLTTGYYGIVASIIAIYVRDDEQDKPKEIKHKYYTERKK